MGYTDTTCEKCGKTISHRARANVWQDRLVVCTPCLRELQAGWEYMHGPPSEPQRKYARDLGLPVPADATKAEVSDILSRHLDDDAEDVAPKSLMELARAAGVGGLTRFAGSRSIYRALWCHWRTSDLAMLAAWFLWNVARDRQLDPGSFSSSAMGGLAQQFLADPKAIKSLLRYEGDTLLDFGESVAPDGGIVVRGTGGKGTIAYTRAEQLLRQQFGR